MAIYNKLRRFSIIIEIFRFRYVPFTVRNRHLRSEKETSVLLFVCFLKVLLLTVGLFEFTKTRQRHNHKLMLLSKLLLYSFVSQTDLKKCVTLDQLEL